MVETTTYGYDCATGELTSEKDPNNLTTDYTYNDPLNRLTNVTYPDTGSTTVNYFDSQGASLPYVTTTQATGGTEGPISRQTNYDGLGRQIHQILTSDPSGADSVDTTYDLLGRVNSVSNPHRSSTLPTDGTTTFAYDALGRRKLQTNPDGSSQQWSYSDNVTTFTDEAGHTWSRNYDALGRLGNVTEPDGASTGYVYDALDNLTIATQVGVSGDTTRSHNFSYDAMSRLITSTNPETGTICYGQLSGGSCQGGYDANGNLLYKTDARGIKTSYTYDALNRLTQKSYSDGTSTIIYGYDFSSNTFIPPAGSSNPRVTTALTNTIGRMAFASVTGTVHPEGSSLFTFSYDAVGRLTNQWLSAPSYQTTGAVNQTSAVYDLAGNVTSLTYRDGRTVNQTWDGAGQQQTSTFASWNGTNVNYSYLTSVIYAPNGGPGGLFYGNGMANGYDRNSRQQIDETGFVYLPSKTTYSVKVYCFGVATQPLASGFPACDQLTSGNNGNILQIKDMLTPANNETFSYDSLNRITGASGPSFSQQYGLDSFGNMSITAGGSFTAKFDPATNRISNLPCSASLTPYDAAGNQLCDSDPNGAFRQYGYNAEGRITQIAMLGSTTPFETYNYDAIGDRVRKSNANGSFTEYIHFGGLTLAEHNSDGSWSDYIYAAGQRIARSDTATAPTNGAASTTFYHSDRLGSTEILTNGNGTLLTSSRFLPFGQEQQISGTATNHYKFTGKERDAETGGSIPGAGNDYFEARYYASSMGRFMSPDWDDDPVPVPYADLTNPQSLNLYAYVNNNPLSHVDQDGHSCDGGSVGPDGLVIFRCTNDPPPNSNGTMYQLAGALGLGFAPETGGASLGVAAGLVGATLAAEYLAAHPIHLSSNEPAPRPPVVGQAQSTPGDPSQNGKPKLVSNSKHHPNSKSPEPPNAKELYDKAIQDSQGRWWAKDADGTIHRFSAESNGETHWNGSTAGSKPIRMDNIPGEIRRALQ